MQTDTWLTEASHPDRCPLCSQPLAGNSNICPSCGFTAHEPARDLASSAQPSSPARTSKHPDPITPIPARASAQRLQNSSGKSSRRSASSRPTRSSSGQRDGGWQHNSPNYEAASSLSSLSLIISETPTAPPRTSRQAPHATGRLEHIDEIDTVPPLPQASAHAVPPDSVEALVPPGSLSLSLSERDVPNLALILSEAAPPAPFPAIDEIDTVPNSGEAPSRALQLVRPEPRELAVNGASWTAGPGSSTSLAAQFIASRPRRQRYPRGFNPLDRARWWLLRPGRIEFLLWLAGSVLLFSITFLLLLATVLSLMLPGLRAGGNFPNSATSGSPGTTVAMTPALSSGLHLALVGKTTLPPGAALRLQGQGFHPRSQVVFLLDGRWALLNQHGQAASIAADASGRFTVDLWLGQGATWSAGRHQILAREKGTGVQVSIAITITSSATTPVVKNPVPVYPTQTHTSPIPTPTPRRPTPTPTRTPTPTPGTTPTPSPTAPPKGSATPAGTSTSSQRSTVNSSNLGNSLNSNDGNSLFASLAHLNPLVWVIGVCYCLSMLLLGMAGILRRRRR